MLTYTNDQAQETLARVRINRAVTREELFQSIVYMLGNRCIQRPTDRSDRVDEVYHKVIGMDFTYRSDVQDLLINQIKHKDWGSINTIMSWLAYPDSAPLNH